MSRNPLLAFAFDIHADDGVVGGLVFGGNRSELGLNTLPRLVLEQIRIRVHCHAGDLLPIAAAGLLVGGAHKRNVADDGDEFVADIPVNDDLGIEGRCPIFQIGRPVLALARGPDIDKAGMKNGVVQGRVVGHKVMDEARVQRAQLVHRLGGLMIGPGNIS
ncbi:MAG: hypothetical protein ACXWJ6_15100 [Xanthobacteraceae bacterium]